MTPHPLINPADLLDVQPTMPSLRFKHLRARAHAETGRSTAAMAREISALFLGPRRIMAHEYFAHRLYDHAQFDDEARARFVGVLASQKYNRVVNDLTEGHGIVGQKLMYNAMLRGFGLPTPPLQALARQFGGAGAILTLADASSIARFLREQARYPLFCKPVRASLSRGAVSINAYSPDSDRLRLIDESEIDPDAFAEAILTRHGRTGYMFEDRLAPHPELAAISGHSLGTIRFVTIVENGRAAPLYALWKAPALNAVADTTWRPGNMLALIDSENGAVQRVQRGSGPDREVLDSHPETGARIHGLRLPDWEAARALALKAAELTPFTRLIGWDLALTDQGPVLVEANGDPNHTLYQLAADHGFLTPEATAFRDRVAAENASELAARRANKRRARRDLLRRYWRTLRRQLSEPPSN
ncbi:MAG: hypothetical protein KTR21_15160 [Rhodobacteraceae bacterium]|nr:hypothetical protein [Paracoccaceae bacterium]